MVTATCDRALCFLVISATYSSFTSLINEMWSRHFFFFSLLHEYSFPSKRGSGPSHVVHISLLSSTEALGFHMFQFEKLEGIPELGVIMEQAERESARDDRLCAPQAPGDVTDPRPSIPLLSPERHLQHQRQVLTQRQTLRRFLFGFI